MQIKPYIIQEQRNQTFEFFNVPRVDYDQLLDSLKFPLIWSQDEIFGWLPAEADFNFVRFLRELPADYELGSLPAARFLQLRRTGLIAPQRRALLDLIMELKQYGYAKINSLLDGEYCRYLMMGYYGRNDHLHQRHRDMPGIKRTSVNNLPLMRLIHQGTEKFVNEIVDEQVKTSYSFTAAYEPGSTLPAHTDRPQCVYNISLMLGSAPFRAKLSNWPLFIKHSENTHAVELEVGDGVLYSGTRDLHWREEMPKGIGSILGVFLHYVPVNFTGSLD